MKRRIRRPKEQELLYKKLVDEEEFGVFSTYKDVFMLAGAVGFMEKKRIEFTSQAEGMPWSVFNLETDESFIDAIALIETEDLSLFNEDDEVFDKKMKIFEEYAAGGIEVVYEKIMENPKQSLNNFFEYIISMEDDLTDKERNLKGIADILF
ncbi:DNA phosphorothioation-associated protein 4 [Saccharibacillus sp. CPCC 101409]|uniref:DNA phosphorothioation-associated protein 4 n=1 Tax=Saccharibacillus sp. CPCC 101409 TaxID=3058041 RepID=UPI002673B0E3|nr:DNA phosphorothioation-associated protein 4 [Saccharibacillus sp. CPCC 101409]MDO3408385.1 DNA phosphorothioation-associated protein 4 [Saccharibacillus sp. CPCC 101409]